MTTTIVFELLENTLHSSSAAAMMMKIVGFWEESTHKWWISRTSGSLPVKSGIFRELYDEI